MEISFYKEREADFMLCTFVVCYIAKKPFHPVHLRNPLAQKELPGDHYFVTLQSSRRNVQIK